MALNLTRVDHAKLVAAVTEAVKDVQKIDEALGKYMTLLTTEDRKKVPRARSGFERAAPGLILLHQKRPKIAGKVPEFNPAAVQEDVANVAALDPLVKAVAVLQQRIDDAILLWNGESWEPSLALYTEASTVQGDGFVDQCIDEMRKILRAGHKPAMTESEKAARKAEKSKERRIAKARQTLKDEGAE